MGIAILGYGTVGKGVAKLLDSMQNPAVKLEKILMVPQYYDPQDPRQTTDYEEILQDPSIDVVVECIGGLEPAHTYAKQALEHQKSFVTSNKKMMAVYRSELCELAFQNGVQVRCEASVGGGITWLKSLERIARVEEIQNFYGIFNGTTNYILSNMQNSSLSFDQLLKQAQQAGYAEKDPTDDIEGYDIGNKVALSCYEGLGLLVKPEQIPTFPLSSIDTQDIAYAAENNGVIKYIGYGQKEYAYVIPTLIPCDNLLANIAQNYNGMLCHSASLGMSFFAGQGAGSLPTGNAVVQDILDIYDSSQRQEAKKEMAQFDFTKKQGVYYIRTENTEPFAHLVDKQIAENTILTKKVSLQEICDCMKQIEDQAFVMEVMA